MSRGDLVLLTPPGGAYVAATDGISTVLGVGQSSATAAAAAAGLATALSNPLVVGQSAGTSTVVGAASVSSPSTALATGLSVVESFGRSLAQGAGVAVGSGVGAAASGGPSVGLSTAVATVTADSAAQKRSVASAAGNGAAAAASSSIVTQPHGTAAGTSLPVAVGRASIRANGNANGIAECLAVGVTLRPARDPVIDIRERAESLAVGTIVEMFELDARNIGGEIYRFCNAAVQSQLISFGGESYFPTQFESEGWAVGSSGPIPRPLIRMNSTVSLLTACADLDDLRGAMLRRIRTLAEYLDDGATPDPSQRFPDEVYIVSNITNKDLIFVEFELMALIDQEGKRIPARQAFRTRCPWIYRRYIGGDIFDYTNATCPYAGQVFLTIKDEVTLDPSKDLCSKRLSACRTRFGPNAVLPYGGFPGMVRV